jgi:2-dehydro-3-deoxyphosphogluconate aldolase/(4S)-4-hydroxy-2-oxoglutarate aldolase
VADCDFTAANLFRSKFVDQDLKGSCFRKANLGGATFVKVFPASVGGPAHLGALHAVFPHVLLCPTGGVTLDNMKSYFTAGAALVGVGNNLLDQDALASGDVARVIAGARRFLDPTVSSA